MKRQRRFVLPVAFLTLLAFMGCGDGNLDARIATARLNVFLGLVRGADATMVREAVAIRRRNAAKEAEAAAGQGDFRLIGVAGVGVFCPGAPSGSRPIERLGVREIMGAGDATDAYGDLYQSAAYRFALTYNRLILKKLNRQQRR